MKYYTIFIVSNVTIQSGFKAKWFQITYCNNGIPETIIALCCGMPYLCGVPYLCGMPYLWLDAMSMWWFVFGINTRTNVNCFNKSLEYPIPSERIFLEASSPELFSLDYNSSSEDECEPRSSRFDSLDLPSLRIPSPFQSDSSGC